MILYPNPTGNNTIPQKTLAGIVQAMINSTLRAFVKGRSGSYSQAVVAVNTFTVTLPVVQQNANYGVIVTPSNLLSSPIHYVDNKTTTSFDVVYPGALTGTVAFDWVLTN